VRSIVNWTQKSRRSNVSQHSAGRVVFLSRIANRGFTGHYREMGPVAIYQAVVYFSAFFGLAGWRKSAKLASWQTSKPEPNCEENRSDDDALAFTNRIVFRDAA
jgi:hypothetical protein